MSLSHDLANFIDAHGDCAVDDMMPLWPEKTRAQMTEALRHAMNMGRLKIVTPGQSLGRNGNIPAVWGTTAKQTAPRPVSFVFDLGRN